MKKLIAWLLAAFMLFGVMAMAGCDKDNTNSNSGNGGGDTTDLYALVSNAMKKTQEVTSYSAVIKQNMKQNLMGTVMETDAEFNIKASMPDPSAPVIGMDGKMATDGEEIPFAYYFDGTWMYYSMYGEGYKMQVSLEEFEQDAGGMDDFFTDLPKDLFTGVTGKTENGTTKVELTATSDAFKTMYQELVTEMFYDVLGEDISAVVVDDVKIVITVANDYVTGYEMSFKASYTIGSDSVSFEVEQSLIFDSINEDVTVTPPEGYENFPEMGWG